MPALLELQKLLIGNGLEYIRCALFRRVSSLSVLDNALHGCGAPNAKDTK